MDNGTHALAQPVAGFGLVDEWNKALILGFKHMLPVDRTVTGGWPELRIGRCAQRPPPTLIASAES